MRLLFIRHGDPDYVHDTLTEKGHKEAALLAERAEDLHLGECYVSPLGRAQATAGYSMKKLGRTAKTLGWLQEFPAQVDLNQAPQLLKAFPNARMEDGKYAPHIVWDIMPSYWAEHSECMDPIRWRECEICRNSDTVEIYDYVTGEFDKLLADTSGMEDATRWKEKVRKHSHFSAILVSPVYSLPICGRHHRFCSGTALRLPPHR